MSADHDNRERMIVDLSCCQPAHRLTRDFQKGFWQLLDYETEDRCRGVMVSAFPEEDCGTLTLSLNVDGPHRIFLGINYTKTVYSTWSSYGQLEVKLTGDRGFRRVGAENPGPHADNIPNKMGVRNEIYKAIQEAYWKTADLTGQSIIFRQPRRPYNDPGQGCISNLTYLRIVKLTEAEVNDWRRERPRPDTRKLAQIFCTDALSGHGAGSMPFHPTEEDWVDDEMEPLVDSDIGILILEVLRGNLCVYPTEVGDIGTKDGRWHDEWIDVLRVFAERSREHRIRLFAGLRLKGLQYPMNRAPIGRASNYLAHPEWAKRDRHGNPTSNLSLAYSGVREHWLNLLRETLAYGIDGVGIFLNRSTPFVMYEQPVVDAFREEFGEDPLVLSERDERWERHCASYVTIFLREIRSLLDEQPGRELAVTIYGRPHKYDSEREGFHPIRYNCDVETWLSQGIIDYLMPSPRVELDLLRTWREIAGDRVHIWPDLMPRTQPGDSYVRLVQEYNAAGADGFSIWDGERRCPRLSEWAAVRRLGHLESLDQLMDEAPTWYRRIPLRTLTGLSVKESFHDG